MAQQTLLRFSLPPGTTLYAKDFRELLARRGKFSPAFFHRGDDGMPVNERARITMVGGPRWVGVLAQPGAEELLYRHMAETAQVLNSYIQRPVAMQLENMTLSAERAYAPVHYRLSEICLRRRLRMTKSERLTHTGPRHRDRHEVNTEQEIREVILRNLAATSRQYGFDLPKDDQIDIQVWIKKELGLQLRLTDHHHAGYAGLVIADIAMNVELGGIWQFGDMSSRGYGRLIRQNVGVPANAVFEHGRPR